MRFITKLKFTPKSNEPQNKMTTFSSGEMLSLCIQGNVHRELFTVDFTQLYTVDINQVSG